MNHKDSFNKIILASSSVRRSYLLKISGLKFNKIISPKIKENSLLNELPKSYAERMAFEKQEKFSRKIKVHIFCLQILLLVTKRKILPKASNLKTATNCLNILSEKNILYMEEYVYIIQMVYT